MDIYLKFLEISSIILISTAISINNTQEIILKNFIAGIVLIFMGIVVWINKENLSK